MIDNIGLHSHNSIKFLIISESNEKYPFLKKA